MFLLIAWKKWRILLSAIIIEIMIINILWLRELRHRLFYYFLIIHQFMFRTLNRFSFCLIQVISFEFKNFKKGWKSNYIVLKKPIMIFMKILLVILLLSLAGPLNWKLFQKILLFVIRFRDTICSMHEEWVQMIGKGFIRWEQITRSVKIRKSRNAHNFSRFENITLQIHNSS